MLFDSEFWTGIAGGTCTRTIRRWKRPQVVAGRRYRTPVGMVEVTSIEPVDVDDLDEDDARCSGFGSLAHLLDTLDGHGDPDATVYRIDFRFAGDDPRTALAHDDDLTDGDVAEITRRLDRLDAASPRGPWTRDTIRAIARDPGRRAAEVAATLGREKLSWKVDVRKLKALGLTISLPLGYELSPRGQAWADAVDLLDAD